MKTWKHSAPLASIARFDAVLTTLVILKILYTNLLMILSDLSKSFKKMGTFQKAVTKPFSRGRYFFNAVQCLFNGRIVSTWIHAPRQAQVYPFLG